MNRESNMKLLRLAYKDFFLMSLSFGLSPSSERCHQKWIELGIYLSSNRAKTARSREYLCFGFLFEELPPFWVMDVGNDDFLLERPHLLGDCGPTHVGCIVTPISMSKIPTDVTMKAILWLETCRVQWEISFFLFLNIIYYRSLCIGAWEIEWKFWLYHSPWLE